jgi:hypothetical protein
MKLVNEKLVKYQGLLLKKLRLILLCDQRIDLMNSLKLDS